MTAPQSLRARVRRLEGQQEATFGPERLVYPSEVLICARQKADEERANRAAMSEHEREGYDAQALVEEWERDMAAATLPACPEGKLWTRAYWRWFTNGIQRQSGRRKLAALAALEAPDIQVPLPMPGSKLPDARELARYEEQQRQRNDAREYLRALEIASDRVPTVSLRAGT